MPFYPPGFFHSFIKNKPENTCDLCEQSVPGNAGSLKVHIRNIRHSQILSLKGSGAMCAKSLSRETRAALKYIIETKHKHKAKSDIDNKDKDKASSDTNSKKTNKCQHLFVIKYLSLMRKRWSLRDFG